MIDGREPSMRASTNATKPFISSHKYIFISHLPSGKGSARFSKIQTHAEKEALEVDARKRLMQSVLQTHPARSFAQTATNDCLHFCMNSASVNLYLDNIAVVDRCR
eukprot:scaffold33672_cov153-Skeletonema_dohrnii-CCMP3373.AAC.6